MPFPPLFGLVCDSYVLEICICVEIRFFLLKKIQSNFSQNNKILPTLVSKVLQNSPKI
jgi:hypothetical protein